MLRPHHNRPARSAPQEESDEIRNRIWGGWALELAREYAASWGWRPDSGPYGPSVERPDRCQDCGRPIAYVYFHHEYVPVDVLRHPSGCRVADVLGDHECAI